MFLKSRVDVFFFFFFSSRRRHTRSLCDWSSDVCSSDLLVDDPGATIEQLMKVVTGPDFPTAGYIYGTGGIREAYTTGRGRSEERRVGKECRARWGAEE